MLKKIDIDNLDLSEYEIADNSDKTITQIISDKADTLVLRSVLINSTAKETIDKMFTEENFLVLLETIENTLEYDKEFFFLKDYLDKTQYMIRLGSEKFSTSGELRKRENETIIALNKLSMTKDKKNIIDTFLDVEYSMREFIPYTEELLYTSMANDYYILNTLQEKLLDSSYELPDIPKQFLASTSYFSYFMPELYDSDPGYIKIVNQYIKELPIINFKQPDVNKYARKVKKRLDLFK